ncbi:hypothetical protein AB3R30_19785 [Leptolyngbyaceae cyanobacterium UHCC 1019]
MLQIFRAGSHIDAHGNALAISPEDLAKSAAAYNPALHEAPIVIGHPSDNAPAYGWIKSLSVSEKNLDADTHQLDPQFTELVEAGRYKKISSSFYTPDSPHNPVPGTYYLRHVGFLGAQPPAIKGLKAVQFAAGDEGVVEFSDWMDRAQISVFRNLRDFLIDQFGMEAADKVLPSYLVEEMLIEAAMPPPNAEPVLENSMSDQDKAQTTDFAEREAELSQREQAALAREIALQRAEYLNFAEGLVKEGKLLPAQKNAAVELLAALSLQEPQTVEFGEGEAAFKGDLKTLFEGFLKNQPKVVEYAEIAGADKAVNPLSDPFEIAKLATDYKEAEKAKGNTVSYAEAISKVTQV